MKILCVGGGPAGLFFALLVKRRHPEMDVEVRERDGRESVQGWGVVLWDDGFDDVFAADPPTGQALAAACYEWHGMRVDRRDDSVFDPEPRGFAIARQRLLALLIERAQQVGVLVRFDREVDPAALPDADLVVAADGVHSRLRRAHVETFGPLSSPSQNRYVWLGATKCFDSFTFAFVESEAGWLWCHAYGHAPDRSTFIVECQPETWRGLGLGALATQETLDLLQRLFAKQLDGAELLALPGAGDAMTWQRFSTLTNRTWHHQNLVLTGDAAHTTHFSIGSGTKLALQDAIGLADSLELDISLAAALTDYEQRRRREIERAQRDAQHSLRWLEELPRYSDRPMEEFVDLLHRRRSSLQGRIAPGAYLRLRRVADGRSALRRSWDRVRSG
ncbi:MAG: FAD-dependent monooxygenase [Microlunatus sp.]|nr:FAD-dependent monooxygenase [Microlunatus sp.]MDN5770804.1 FAD-dependent monooxygenase [Microlunatus sp.]